MFEQAPVRQPPADSPPASAFEIAENGEPPCEKRRRQEDALKNRRGMKLDRFAECIVIQVDTDKAIAYKDPNHTQVLQALCGRYFKVGMLDGHQVFRQERGVPITGANKTRFENCFPNENESHYDTTSPAVSSKKQREHMSLVVCRLMSCNACCELTTVECDM